LAAPALNVILLSPEIRTLTDLESALSALASDRPDALLIFVDPFTLTHRRRIVDFAAATGLPAVYEDRIFVEAGGLMSYGPSVEDNCRRAAGYVDKISQRSKTRPLGLKVPDQVLATADEVIE